MAASPPPRTASDYGAASALLCLGSSPATNAATLDADAANTLTALHTAREASGTYAGNALTTAAAAMAAITDLDRYMRVEAARTLYDVATGQSSAVRVRLAANEKKRKWVEEWDKERGYETEDEEVLGDDQKRGKEYREHTPEGCGWEEEVWLEEVMSVAGGPQEKVAWVYPTPPETNSEREQGSGEDTGRAKRKPKRERTAADRERERVRMEKEKEMDLYAKYGMKEVEKYDTKRAEKKEELRRRYIAGSLAEMYPSLVNMLSRLGNEGVLTESSVATKGRKRKRVAERMAVAVRMAVAETTIAIEEPQALTSSGRRTKRPKKLDE